MKLIVCDLDETLLDDQRNISEKNRLAIQKAREKGILFVPATGRGYNRIDDILKNLNLYQQSGEYIISMNGAVIVENNDYKHLTFHTLPYEDASSIIAFGIKKELEVQVFTPKKVYRYDPNAMKWYLGFHTSDAISGSDHSFLKELDITKVLFYKNDMAYLLSLEKELEQETMDKVTISYSSGCFMEFNVKGVSKGLALKELCHILDIAMEDTLAIGDNLNDVSMLKEAGISAAVANAFSSVKDICDYVAKNDNNHSAVAEIIEKFI